MRVQKQTRTELLAEAAQESERKLADLPTSPKWRS